MYLDYYELDTKPFQITVDPTFLWLGDKHKEALATLRYGIMDNRGFLLLTGEVGTGKTILINQLIKTLEIGTVVATIPDPDLVSMDFYNLLADGFQMNRTFDSKSAFLIHLRDFLYKTNADQKQVLLIIDESQRLNHQLMEDIRVLSNIELHDRKLINVFFVGQQEFNNILMTPQNRALAQRITVRYHIEPLNQDETELYIQHRLKLAGGKRMLFKKSSIPEIFSFSNGIPRLINIICDHSLLTGFSQGKKQIDDAIVRECAVELQIPTQNPLGGNLKVVEPAHKKIEPIITEAVNAKTSADIIEKASESDRNASGVNPTGPNPVDHEKHPNDAASHSSAWRAVVLFALFVLIGLIAFSLIQFNRSNGPRWDTDDLTPKKYLSTLEKEKEKLANRLENGDNDLEEGTVSIVNESVSAPQDSSNKTSTNATDSRNGDQPPTSFLDAEIEPLPLMMEKTIIQFSLNSNEISPNSYDILDRIAQYLKRHSDKTIHVRGYTDDTGSDGYNESVSRFRAGAVKSYLLGKGAPADNIKVFGMGRVNPIASNDTALGRSQNRRVEIEFPDAGSDGE